MRRLPVYLVLDVSGSMYGEPLEAVKNGVQELVAALRRNPYALETACLSVIVFESAARQLTPLTDLMSFTPPTLEIGGFTSLGEGLSLLAKSIRSEVRKTTADTKGDWKPLVFLMTDGQPTDDWQAGLAELKREKLGLFVACGAGDGADAQLLKQLTDSVVMLAEADGASIAAFFKWVSASVTVGSERIETGKELQGISQLPPPPPEVQVVI